uniref:hypothetical protein n=1 Tax=Thermoflexus sp. TaxID=1969742 RepID=UPI002ADDB7A7
RWTLFIHLVDEAGRLWANWDAEPDPPTDRWVPGQVYDVGRSLLIPRFVPAGRYRVNLGWYETGTPGFPRLPLTVGGDVLTLGWIEVRPILGSALWGARSIGIVEMQPPEVIVRPSAEGWRIWVQVEWRAREPVPFSAWEVVLVAPEGPLPLQRAYRVPEGARGGSVWSVETWVSPELRGGWPALRWVEIRYAGHLLAREPVWLFPPSTTWSYDWLFLNQVWFIR